MFMVGFSIVCSLIYLSFGVQSTTVIKKDDLLVKIEDFLESEAHKDAVESVKRSLPAVVLIHIFDDSVKNDGKIYNAAFSDKKSHNHYVINGAMVHPNGYLVTTYDTLKKHNRIIVSINSENRKNSADSSMIITNDDYDAEVIEKIPELNIAVLKINSKKGEKFSCFEIANIGQFKNSKNSLLYKCSFVLGKSCGDSFITPRHHFIRKNNFQVLASPIEEVFLEKIVGVEYFIAKNQIMQSGVFCENAGGALVDSVGRLLGIIDYKSTEKNLFLKNIVIPCDVVEKALEMAVPSLRKTRNNIDLGVAFTEDSEGRVCIETVKKDSTADRCGLRQGDVILKFNNENITKMDEVQNMLDRSIMAGSLVFTVIRGVNTAEIEVTAYR